MQFIPPLADRPRRSAQSHAISRFRRKPFQPNTRRHRQIKSTPAASPLQVDTYHHSAAYPYNPKHDIAFLDGAAPHSTPSHSLATKQSTAHPIISRWHGNSFQSNSRRQRTTRPYQANPRMSDRNDSDRSSPPTQITSPHVVSRRRYSSIRPASRPISSLHCKAYLDAGSPHYMPTLAATPPHTRYVSDLAATTKQHVT